MHKMLIKLFYLKKNAYENVWGNMKPTERGKYLVRLTKIIELEAPRLGKLEVKIMVNYQQNWEVKLSIVMNDKDIMEDQQIKQSEA